MQDTLQVCMGSVKTGVGIAHSRVFPAKTIDSFSRLARANLLTQTAHEERESWREVTSGNETGCGGGRREKKRQEGGKERQIV